MAKKRGLLVVLSAPSGAGKASLIKQLADHGVRLAHPVSVTTRAPRDGERDGHEYHFRSPSEFARLRDQGAFVEWAEVHGQYYGTLRTELERCLSVGDDVVLELDVQGMRNLREAGMKVVSVFLMPPSLDELERRLRSRGQNDEASISLRMLNARDEIEARDDYDHVVVNDDLERAAREFERILETERARQS